MEMYAIVVAITVYREKKIWVKKGPKPALITLHCVVLPVVHCSYICVLCFNSVFDVVLSKLYLILSMSSILTLPYPTPTTTMR